MYKYTPLDENDKSIYEKYKKQINAQIRETFPSIPSDFDLKPVAVKRMEACGTIYHYKVLVPDNKYAEVQFLVGGMYMPPPGVKDFVPPDPTFTVESTLTSTPDDD